MRQQLISKIGNYENWISGGCKDQIPKNRPLELYELFKQDKSAYTFYRNELFLFAHELYSERRDFLVFREFLKKIRNDYGKQYLELLDHYSNDRFADLFEGKRSNAFQISREITSSEISYSFCFLYQSYYEIDPIYLFLSSLSKLVKDNIIDLQLDFLKDKRENLIKGLAINYIISSLSDFPEIITIIKTAFNTKLRNTIGHNSYVLKNNAITSLDNKIKIEKPEFFESLFFLQEINNQLLYCLSSHSISNEIDDVKDCGVLLIAFGYEKESPVLVLFQLWSFFMLDRAKDWITDIVFTKSNNLHTTIYSERFSLSDTFSKDLESWHSVLKNNTSDQLNVIIHSIKPRTKKKCEFVTCGFGEFELTNTLTEIKRGYQYNVETIE